MPEPEYLARTAVFSPCGFYRYRLGRRWRTLGPPVLFVMLNPSTADVEQLDPTVRRCVGFAQGWGFGAVEVVNLFAIRATDPAALYRIDNPVGAENDEHIRQAASEAARIIVAWGVHGEHRDRGAHVSQLLTPFQPRVWSLGTTKDGHPRHPLYLPSAAPLQPWGRMGDAEGRGHHRSQADAAAGERQDGGNARCGGVPAVR